MKRKAEFGSISSGTMRERDLIPVFADELERLEGKRGQNAGLLKVARAVSDFDSEEAVEICFSLFDALDEHAPPYGYFGAHPGDGADYGFWLTEDWERAARDDDALFVTDTAEVPRNFAGDVFQINDHGNVTLYHKARTQPLREIWSVV